MGSALDGLLPKLGSSAGRNLPIKQTIQNKPSHLLLYGLPVVIFSRTPCLFRYLHNSIMPGLMLKSKKVASCLYPRIVLGSSSLLKCGILADPDK